MPTYEYECRKCGYAFEKFQNITAEPIKKCPQCKRMTVKRLVSAGAGLLFKGSGFYETDYRSKAYKEAAKSDSAAASTKSGSGNSGGESKAAKSA